jgi:hypothetical protein
MYPMDIDPVGGKFAKLMAFIVAFGVVMIVVSFASGGSGPQPEILPDQGLGGASSVPPQPPPPAGDCTEASKSWGGCVQVPASPARHPTQAVPSSQHAMQNP